MDSSGQRVPMRESATPPSDETATLEKAVDTLSVFCGVVLLSFTQHGRGLRDTIARNFVARGMRCTQSILAVWKAGSEQDAWILHRTLVDRLLHLHYLSDTDSFQSFEDYSFVSMFEARQRLLSEPLMRSKIPIGLKGLQEANKARYDQRSDTKSRWRRPRASAVATDMKLGFLYQIGYDYASTHVHPMADDGEGDFLALVVGPGPQPTLDSTVVKNSILVQCVLVRESINVSSMRWRNFVWDFLDQIIEFIGTGNVEYQTTMLKIINAWPSSELCEAPIREGPTA
jgi:hypothetical protein